MADHAEADKASGPPRTARTARRYDSAIRRERARETRDRIVAAGCDLAREFPTWDWRGLTAAAVADRAGVNKTTVYRHFPAERDLHDAIMLRLEDEAGVSYETIDLENLKPVIERLFAGLSAFAAGAAAPQEPPPPTLSADRRRREALLRAVTPATAGWPDGRRAMLAAVLDLLWSRTSYERLTNSWGFDSETATAAVTWAVDVLLDAATAGSDAASRD